MKQNWIKASAINIRRLSSKMNSRSTA